MTFVLNYIAIPNLHFRYVFSDEYWRHSIWCTLAGVLSTVSSEASVFFLCLITLDRFLVIKYPFSQLTFTTNTAIFSSIFAWIVSLSIAITPVIYTGYFQNSFYSKSGVCIALPLTRDRPPGWLYSVLVFIGLNFVTFILIAIGQLSIYKEIKKVTSVITVNRGNSGSGRGNELAVARNLLLVVTTDFLCWFPIGCMGMFTLYFTFPFPSTLITAVIVVDVIITYPWTLLFNSSRGVLS